MTSKQIKMKKRFRYEIRSHFSLSHTMVSSHSHAHCMCVASFFSRLFSSCYDIATFMRFLLCNSNKILVIQEIFRWYYKHLILSRYNFTQLCCAYSTYLCKRSSFTQRASYMFIYLYFKVKIVLKPPVLVLNLAKVY